MRNVSGLETVYEDYSDKNVKFYYLYKALAHPERDGLVQPATLDERLLHVREAQRRFNTQWTWLADSPDNQVKIAFGNRPNSEFIVDPEGKVIRSRMWSDEETLRKDLDELVGAPKKRTSTRDLKEIKNLPSDRKSQIARNVVPRVELPAGAKALIVESLPKGKDPLYLKLRAHAESNLISTGTGSMRIGFWLDPIHSVHWNNLAAPLSFSFLEEGAKEETIIEPTRGTAPKVEVESDYDPREFLITMKEFDTDKPLKVQVKYFACHDTEDWCKAVTQEFEITFQADPHAGTAPSERGKRGSGGDGRERRERPSGGGGSEGRPKPDPAQFFTRYDANGDGKLELTEAPERMQSRFTHIDSNEDNSLSKEEIESHFDRR